MDLTVSFSLYTELAEFTTDVSNISLANYNYGASIDVQCVVETCISDLVLQLFRADQLIEMDTFQEGSRMVGLAKVKATEEMAGEYVCQGLSEKQNQVFHKTFFITGKKWIYWKFQ